MKILPFLMLMGFFVHPKIVVEQVKGQPFLIKVDEDKVAMIHSQHKSVNIKIPFEVSDNGCNNRTGAKGHFKIVAGLQNFSAIWIKHPHSAKLNTIVTSKLKGAKNANPLRAQFFINSLERHSMPLVFKSLPNEEFAASNYEWLDYKTVPEKFTVDVWNIEAMFPNPETGVMENQSFFAGRSVEFVKNNQQTLMLAKAKTLSPNVFFFGDIWSLSLKNTKGEICQIALKPNIADAQNDICTLYSTPLPKPASYLWEEDEYSILTNPITRPVFFTAAYKKKLEEGGYELE